VIAGRTKTRPEHVRKPDARHGQEQADDEFRGRLGAAVPGGHEHIAQRQNPRKHARPENAAKHAKSGRWGHLSGEGLRKPVHGRCSLSVAHDPLELSAVRPDASARLAFLKAHTGIVRVIEGLHHQVALRARPRRVLRRRRRAKRCRSQSRRRHSPHHGSQLRGIQPHPLARGANVDSLPLKLRPGKIVLTSRAFHGTVGSEQGVRNGRFRISIATRRASKCPSGDTRE